MNSIRNATILIVDDQPDNLQVIQDILLQTGIDCDILKAPNGRIALKVLKKRTPDLVITDWDMPVMDGIELIRKLKENPDLRDIPVIMCTGVMTTSENLNTALDAGAVDYIRKPVDPIELVARMGSMLKLGASFKRIQEQNKILRENHEKMERMARTDTLTGLPNRRDLLDKFESVKAATDRNGRTFVLALGDIDHFKTINDTYGHDCGDGVLISIAGLLKEMIRKQDYVGRWGGEEFLMIFPEIHATGGQTIAEKIRRAIAEHSFQYQDVTLKLSMTIGLSIYIQPADFDEHLKQADEALYKGKAAGRNRVVLFS